MMPFRTWRKGSKRPSAPISHPPRGRSPQSHSERRSHPIDARVHLPKDPLARQIQKLDKIIEAIRLNENVEVTRLTVVKKLCENPEAAGAFAMFLARKSQERLREKQGNQRYRQLVNRAIREMKPYLDDPTEERKWQLLSRLKELVDEQNEHEWIKWGAVRKIKSWDLLTVERTLRAVLRRDEAPYWLYQAARDHVGSSTYLTKESIPRDRGDRPILATVFQDQSIRRIINSGAASTPFSISTKDETHAHFQRLVPPGNGRFDVHDSSAASSSGDSTGALSAVLANRWFNGSVALSPSCEPTLHRSDRKSRELPPHRSLEGKGNRHFVAGQSGGSARLVS